MNKITTQLTDTSNKMTIINPSLSLITLKLNALSSPIKRTTKWMGKDELTVIFIRNPFQV
jgi:hypothetical protein